ncbi:diaminopimelate epimerase [Desulfuromonas thiophila]|uniref:Diaminopimelate epimerase n=1 Tax=Desulfuromonas thiophila TaxID=57664 RepID=A0A1G6XDU7_9BACT|nr:diaminopimelate epimerase [Desulfuromonas thiophila]SDD76251.1 diaminopimelate epimerase [Desulfuromonas thiophila]
MRFVKMQGIGNDYVYIDGFDQQIEQPERLAARVSDRHFGIGGDGLILILPSQIADARMRVFNADGSEAQMCGNGIRCVAKYLYEARRVQRRELTIETAAGLRQLQLRTDAADRVVQVSVDMGAPRLQRSALPMTGPSDEQALGVRLELADQAFEAYCLSMGNPHCVIFVPDVAAVPLALWGPQIETHAWFPERINVEFVQVLSPEAVRQRTWERGAGETLACGTGASAVTVAGFLSGRTGRRIRNQLTGGELELYYSEEGPVIMTGPAVEVCRGTFVPAELLT